MSLLQALSLLFSLFVPISFLVWVLGVQRRWLREIVVDEREARKDRILTLLQTQSLPFQEICARTQSSPVETKEALDALLVEEEIMLLGRSGRIHYARIGPLKDEQPA